MKKHIFVPLLAACLLSCGSTAPSLTLYQKYPQLYKEQPATIAIMPPINETRYVEAKDFLYATLYQPLCEKGYYVFPPQLTDNVFQGEGVSEFFIDSDNLSVFNEKIGADALMFTVVKEWERYSDDGGIVACVEYVMRSTKTGALLYRHEGRVSMKVMYSDADRENLTEIISQLTADMIPAGEAAKVNVGRRCNVVVLGNMPVGRYHPLFKKDRNKPAGDDFVEAIVGYE